MKKLKTDLCILGAGAAGLSIAAGAAQMGASVVLIEKSRMGGDCLNTGCIPSKALLAAAKSKHAIELASQFGIHAEKVLLNFQKTHQSVHEVIAKIEPNDSIERFEGMGVNVIQAEGRFLTPKTVQAGDYNITARRFVIATGSHAATPNIQGLDQVDFLTNETIFDLTHLPESLAIIGGGPIGCEMALAHARLGCKVTLLEAFTLLPKDEPELVAMLHEQLIQEGITIKEHCHIERVEQAGSQVKITLECSDKQQLIQCEQLLIAAGRTPTLQGLDLEKANIAFTAKGITVDQRLRSISNKRVFAAGDIAGGPQFTHIAAYHAGIIIKNTLFLIPAKVNYRTLPWVTYTDPELAHVGLTEVQARQQKKAYRTLTWSFEDNDRAQTDRQTAGMIKVIVSKGGRILGCSILGKNAGELILTWSLAIQENLRIGSIANLIAPYPTLSEISKRVAGSYYTETLFSNRTKRIVKLIQRFF